MNTVEDDVAAFLGRPHVDWDELKPILCFVVLWNRLEVWHGCELHYQDLLTTVQETAGKTGFKISEYGRQIEFIRKRYKSLGIDGLSFRKNESNGKEALNRLVLAKSASDADCLLGLMMLPYRVRNNLFHRKQGYSGALPRRRTV